jgi:AsmA protein
MKRVVKTAAIVVALLLVVALALPFLVDANQFRPMLETKLSAALGRQVSLGSLQLSIFSGSVTANDLSISDDPAFSKTPFLRAKSLAAGVELMPLIMSRKLNVTGVTIDQPDIDLIQTPAGSWNFSSLGAPSATPTPPPAAAPEAKSSAPPDLTVNLVKITNGRLTLAKEGAKAKPLILDKVNIEVKDFSTASSFPFSLTATLPGDGKIKLDGKAGPINAGNAIATPFDANLSVSHVDLAVAGLVESSTGIGALVAIDGSAASNGTSVTVKGKVKAEQLKLVKGGTPAKSPAEIDVTLTHDLKKQFGAVNRADIHLGKAVATLTGAYQLSGDTPTVNLKLVGDKIAVTELTAFLPALNVVLPAGATIDQGTVAVNISSEGSLENLVSTGTLDVENSRLSNYDLASKLKVLEALGGIKAEPHTSIETLSANLKNSTEGTALQDIKLIVPSIGTITGAGTVSAAQALDFKMQVVLRDKLTVPFTVAGTSKDPSFKPDMKGVMKDQLKGAASGLLDGLFGGKKK